MRATVSLRRGVGVLYAGVVVFVGLAAFTARSIWVAWQERSGDARAAAVFDLVAERTPPRPTDAPGAMAWLRLELDRFGRRIADPERARRFARFAAGGDRVPDPLAPLVDVMRTSIDGEPPPRAPLPSGPAASGPAASGPAASAWTPASSAPALQAAATALAARPSLREQQVLAVGGRPVVVTRRRASAPEHAASDAFVARLAPRLVRAAGEIDRAIGAAPLPPVPGDRPPRPVRLYAVSDDGTLVSAPWRERAGSGAPAEPDAAADELSLLAGHPGLPTFAPEEFFFAFDPAVAAPRAAYSGFYLDVGGRGLVSTVLVPFAAPDGRRGVLALDLAFAIDWRALARGVAPPVIGAALDLGGAGATAPPWTAFDAQLPADAPDRLRGALAQLAAQPAPAGDDGSPLRHGIVASAGAVAAFQVADRTWLVMLFPRASPAFPIAPIALLGGLLAVLLTGFEVYRRRADAERRKAEAAFAEKQNLLDTMQVPLVVVDPNTDVIVSANRAAGAIGVRAGARFADLVWPDARARAHYERMQVATPEPRRAYGVPVAVRDDDGRTVERYAVMRSVAVTAPIEALAADERHRLGVFFVLDQEADLALLAADIAGAAHREERRRLAGLLSHGVDTLARVLEHLLRTPDPSPESRAFAAWLSEYLERRLTVTAWLLDHWDATPPLAREVVIDGAQAAATVARLAAVFGEARRDRALRARLHWDNGTLAGGDGDPADDRPRSGLGPLALEEHAVQVDPGLVGADRRDRVRDPVLDVAIDWPADYVVTCPVRGGFGLFVGELVGNAVRHGRPATRPRVRFTCDRVRKELALAVDNAIDPAAASSSRGDAYGGLAIVRAMARLFGWHEVACGPAGDRFVAHWTLPAGERTAGGDAD